MLQIFPTILFPDFHKQPKMLQNSAYYAFNSVHNALDSAWISAWNSLYD